MLSSISEVWDVYRVGFLLQNGGLPFVDTAKIPLAGRRVVKNPRMLQLSFVHDFILLTIGSATDSVPKVPILQQLKRTTTITYHNRYLH